MLASPPHLSQHQRTTSPPPLSSSCSSRRSAKLKTSNPCNHRNQQYSIIGLTNAAGTLVERYSYTAYGTLGIYDPSGTVRTTSTYANRYTYTGREYDADLHLYHFRARWYDPASGGFISRDPLGYVDGRCLYRGCFRVKGMDSSGRLYQSDGRPTTMDMHQIKIDSCDGKSQPNAQAKAGDKELDENKQLIAEKPNSKCIGLDGQSTMRDKIVNDLVNGQSAKRMFSNVYSQLRKNGCAVQISCECC